MAYEHEPLHGNRADPQLRHDLPRQGGSTGPLLLAGALLVAVIGGIYAYSGPDTPEGDAPVATQSPAADPVAPAATDPVATQPAAPADPAPAADPARDPSGAIPGVEPMVPTQPEPAPAP